MKLNGANRNTQFLGDLFVAFALEQVFNNFFFSLAEFWFGHLHPLQCAAPAEQCVAKTG